MPESHVLHDGTFDQAAPAPSPAAISAVSTRSNSTLLGDVAWLMMESDWHRGRRVDDFARLVMPPIGLRQFRLFHDGDVPIAYASWAFLSTEAEGRFLADPLSLEPADWASGGTAYLVDFLAPNNALRKVLPYMRADPLLRRGPVRGLRTRNGIRMLIEIAATGSGTRVRSTPLE